MWDNDVIFGTNLAFCIYSLYRYALLFVIHEVKMSSFVILSTQSFLIRLCCIVL